ncbi:MAG: hypothetical protein JXA71_10040 [Chitinispirillaceae bacterium]|nr:hypothetical protein [Chitinispirillaceae bacterium]
MIADVQDHCIESRRQWRIGGYRNKARAFVYRSVQMSCPFALRIEKDECDFLVAHRRRLE